MPSASSSIIFVRREDLPIYCPPASQSLWNQHPRVYIPIDSSQADAATCPYCGNRFKLTETESDSRE